MEKSPFLLLLTSKRLVLGTLVLFLLIQACALPRAIQTIQATPTAAVQGLPPTPIPSTPTPLPSPTPTPIPAARIEGGDYALFIGDWEGALDEFQTARSASLEPEIQAAALLGIGRVYYYTGDLARALDVLRELVGTYPASTYSPAAYFYLGQIYTSLTRYSEAIEAYTNYLSLRPGIIDTYILEWRGDAYFAMGNYSAALSDFLAAWQSPHLGEGFPLQIKIAETYSLTGDYATAILMYNDIYSRTSDDYTKARADYLLGQT